MKLYKKVAHYADEAYRSHQQAFAPATTQDIIDYLESLGASVAEGQELVVIVFDKDLK